MSYKTKHQWAIKLLSLLIIITRPVIADVNILVIGSPTDSSTIWNDPIPTVAFDPTQVVAELTDILLGADQGAVNVVFEDFYGNPLTLHHTNLFSWFHHPYPINVETTVRWPNLRGELDTEWDYVVLIGDAHTIERLPGFYALGVSEISKEVAKGTAETVLLMPWPAEGSVSSIEHYKEVVYRLGRTGGCLVAPAGLAWEASAEVSGATHPTDNGAYIAAATVYSRIFNQSASTSTYDYNDDLADLAHATVQENKGAVQYTGKFTSPHPHKAQFNTNRNVDFSITGTSTERGHIAGLEVVMDACRVNHTKHFSHRYNSDDPIAEQSGWPVDEAGAPIGPIDFNFGKFLFSPYDEFNVNPDFWKRTYIFRYQSILTEDIAVARICEHDRAAGVRAYQRAPYVGATIPRSSWAMLHRLKPGIEMNGSGNHLTDIAILPNACFMYTVDSGRCPLTSEVESPSDQWHAMRVGYEAGWIMGNLQARAPGFRVLPSSADKQEINNYQTAGSEEMTVQFIFEPEEEVTVHLTSSNPSLINISPSTLTFTPENHDVAQSYTVSIADGAITAEEEITVNVTTTSVDEVYNDLSDSWVYTAKARDVSSSPVAVGDDYRVGVNDDLVASIEAGVTANDITNPLSPITQVALVTNVNNGMLNLSSDGSFIYSPNIDFNGIDSFSYTVANANGNSNEVTVTITVSDLDPGLILWYDFEELNGATVKDLTVHGRHGTINNLVPQVAGVADEKFGADLTGGTIDIPIDEDYTENFVDGNISIAFWTYLNSSSGTNNSYLLRGSKTYGPDTYNSLQIRFQTRVADNEIDLFWEHGIYTQDAANDPIGIPNNAGSYRLRSNSDDTGLTAVGTNDQWVHWTFVKIGGGDFVVYKDGVLVDQNGLAGLLSMARADEIDQMVLGDNYDGSVDDFRVYNRRLTVSEISKIMVESSPPADQAWTGDAAEDDLWVNPENWSLGTVPQIGSLIEIGNGDVIDISSGAIFPAFSTTVLSNGELAIGQEADLILQEESILKVDGGSITRDFAVNDSRVDIGVNGGSSVLEFCSGEMQFINGLSDIVYIYSDMIISGGNVNMYTSTRLYGGLTIKGTDATIDHGSFNLYNGSSIHFELDSEGVSPINIDTWTEISNALISIDGSSYTGGTATIPLLNAGTLRDQNDNITITGLEGRGYTAQVLQSQASDDVKLVITQDTSDTDGDGQLDWEEVIFGTSPSDSTSKFELGVQRADSGLALSWPTVSGRVYSIESSEDLDVWEVYLEGVPYTPGDDAEVNILDDVVSENKKFFRIRVQN